MTSFRSGFNVALRKATAASAQPPPPARGLAPTPTGQSRRSICFTYCALLLHGSYLTLICSYQSRPLAAKVPRQPQVPLPDGGSLMQRRKECWGGGCDDCDRQVRRRWHANIQMCVCVWGGGLTVRGRQQEAGECDAPTPAPYHRQSSHFFGEDRGRARPGDQEISSLCGHIHAPDL